MLKSNFNLLLDDDSLPPGGGDDLSNIDTSNESDAVFGDNSGGESFGKMRVTASDSSKGNVNVNDSAKNDVSQTEKKVEASATNTNGKSSGKLGGKTVKMQSTGELNTDGLEDENEPKGDEARSAESTLKDKDKEGENKAVEDKGKDKSGRDYSGLSESDIEFLKKQPNNVYNVVLPIARAKAAAETKLAEQEAVIQQLKADPNRLPENWYEHERAIEMTPEWSALNEQYSRHETEATHWQRQMARIQSGSLVWQPLQYSKERGYYPGPEQAVPEDIDKRVALLSEMETAKTKMTTGMAYLQQKADTLTTEFKKNYQQINTYYDEPIKKYFGGMPKELAPQEAHEKQLVDLVHPAHRNHPLVKLAGKLFSVALNQGEAIRKLRGEASTKNLIQQDRQAAGPKNTTGGVTTGTPNGAGRPIIAKDGKLDKKAEVDFSNILAEMEEA